MKKVNLRDLYPDVYKTDYFVEVTEDVLETIRAAERAEAAYDRRMYRYKAYYSLDCDNGIENAGKVSTDYRPPELTVMNVETEITTNMLLIDSLSVGLLILFSTCAASVLIFRKKPKDILSEMS